jgi:hypothetical protein
VGGGGKGGGGNQHWLIYITASCPFFGCRFWLVVDCETVVCVWHEAVVAIAVAMEVVLLPAM